MTEACQQIIVKEERRREGRRKRGREGRKKQEKKKRKSHKSEEKKDMKARGINPSELCSSPKIVADTDKGPRS